MSEGASRTPGAPPVQTEALSSLLAQSAGAVWRVCSQGSLSAFAAGERLSTGFPRLDAVLPGGGWPPGTLVEVLSARAGIGEVSLWLPALQRLAASPVSRACDDGAAISPARARWLAWISPPYVPYGPALLQAGILPEQVLWVAPRSPTESLWAMEQVLRSGACAAAFGWAHPADDHALRRLKLAASQGGTLGILFRPVAQAAVPSPASLRLVLHARPAGGLDIEILKCQGGRPGWIRDALRHG